MKTLKTLFLFMIVSTSIAIFWNQIPLVKESVHYVLNPTAGKLLYWNISIGMVLFAALISLFITLVQKYTTDQETLREIKKEQKILQEEIKKYKDHPEKLMALQKKQMEFIPRTMEITLRPLIYTSIPMILFFRWFNDYFSSVEPAKILGIFSTSGFFLIFPSWIWAYILLSVIFTSIFRKLFDVA